MKKINGSILLSLIFIILISFIGLSILTYSVTHLRIVRARTERENKSDLLYNKLFFYLHNITDNVKKSDLSQMEDIETDLFNAKNFPEIISGHIRIFPKITLADYKKDLYKKTVGKIDVRAHDSISRLTFLSGIKFTVFSGDIPVRIIPFLITGSKGNDPAKFMKAKKIEQTGNISEPVVFNKKPDINLEKFFNDNFINYDDFSIRYELKKDQKNKKNYLSSNIFFFSDDLNCSNILINTNVDSLIFTALSEHQFISIKKEDEIICIEYIPGENFLNISGVDRFISGTFGEKIVINGNIGVMKQSGSYAFAENSRLIIVTFGDIKIEGDLISPDKVTSLISPLTIVNTFNPFIVTPDTGNNISLCGGRDSMIEVSFITEGMLINQNSLSVIKGILSCKDIENYGIIKIYTDYSSSVGDWVQIDDFIFLKEFFIDYIEESYDR